MKKNKKIGLALSGGGTRSFAYIGMIKAFEEENLKFDMVAGTSAGSIFGALYCSGLKATEIIKIITNIKKKDILKSLLFNSTAGIEDIMKKMVGDINIEDLPIPLTAVSVNLNTGKEVRISKGNLAKIVAASCAVPIIFNLVEYEGYRLFDGGMVNNVPANICKENGCDIVITVDINNKRGKGTNSSKLLDILASIIDISTKNNSLGFERYSDCIITPDLSMFKRTSFDNIMDMISIGYTATKAKMPEILELIRDNKRNVESYVKKRMRNNQFVDYTNNIIEELR